MAPPYSCIGASFQLRWPHLAACYTHPLFWPGLPGSLGSRMLCTLWPSCSQNACTCSSVASLGSLERNTCAAGGVMIMHHELQHTWYLPCF